MNKFPHAIVIGAQKCGTTSLFQDLSTIDGVFLGEKESKVLADSFNDPSVPVSSRYDRLFSAAKEGDFRIEVSTYYTMYPKHPEAATNLRSSGAPIKLIYIVRDPVERSISQHHHDYVYGNAPYDFAAALRARPEIISNSKYATQLSRWRREFEREDILVLKFEEYMADRRAGLNAVSKFLGLSAPVEGPPDRIFNSAEDKRVPTGRLRALSKSRFYRERIRPLVPAGARSSIMRVLLPPVPDRPAHPDSGTLGSLVEELQTEVDALAGLLGTDPWWDLSRHLNSEF